MLKISPRRSAANGREPTVCIGKRQGGKRMSAFDPLRTKPLVVAEVLPQDATLIMRLQQGLTRQARLVSDVEALIAGKAMAEAGPCQRSISFGADKLLKPST